MKTSFNKYLNDLNLTVKKGEYRGYKIKFALDFKDGGSEGVARESAENTKIDNFNYGNSLAISNKDAHKLFEPKDNGDTIGGVTSNNIHIIMNNTHDDFMNRLHEIFHTLGFSHPEGGGTHGIMNYPPHKPDRRDANELAYNSFLPTIEIDNLRPILPTIRLKKEIKLNTPKLKRHELPEKKEKKIN